MPLCSPPPPPPLTSTPDIMALLVSTPCPHQTWSQETLKKALPEATQELRAYVYKLFDEHVDAGALGLDWKRHERQWTLLRTFSLSFCLSPPSTHLSPLPSFCGATGTVPQACTGSAATPSSTSRPWRTTSPPRWRAWCSRSCCPPGASSTRWGREGGVGPEGGGERERGRREEEEEEKGGGERKTGRSPVLSLPFSLFFPSLPQGTTPEDQCKAVGKIFGFAYTWALGGNLIHTFKEEFDLFAREQLGAVCSYPGGGLVYDYMVDGSKVGRAWQGARTIDDHCRCDERAR